MHKFIILTAVVALAGCERQAAAPVEDANLAAADANLAVDANMAVDGNATVIPAGMSHLNTTWEFTSEGKPMVISIDSAGGYIVEGGDGTHVDHGTMAVKDGKDCFTSAMGDKSTMCYTAIAETAIGSTAASTDDKGVTVDYKRVEYRPLTM